MRGTTARRRLSALVAVALAGALMVGCDLPNGFHEYVVFEGLNQPTNVEFAPDGRVYVAEKRGVVRAFDGLDDATPTTVADLRTNTFNGWDRGMLGLGIAPDFATDRALYVLYTYDAEPGGTAPRWGRPGVDVDNCPTPPGYTEDGCLVTARLSKLPLDAAGAWTGQEQVLLQDWCQQYPSHSIGSMAFGSDGSLYVSGGDGGSFTFTDYGQDGNPRNPCGDPPVPVGGAQVPATAEGGTLRSQDVRTLGDPTGLGGAIIRIDPDTGAPMPGNPLIGSPNVGARRIVAHGFRNPFRFTLRPGTQELWIGDVGWDTWEEVDVSVGNDATLDNFGWPCYEGAGRQGAYDGADVGMCERLYGEGAGAVRPPFFTYRHDQDIVEGEDCDDENGSSVSGLAFQPADSPYPGEWDGGLFFADAARQCIWRMGPGADGRPDPSQVRLFSANATTPVDLQFGPGGELWYVDLYGGTIKRIGYSASNHPPAPRLVAEPTSGEPPLRVRFDASGSTDQDPGDTLSFAWDLDGDGAFDDGTGAVLEHTFTEPGLELVRVRATDTAGASEVARTSVRVGSPDVPVPVIEQPVDQVVAAVGSTVEFAGWGADADGNLLPPSALSWQADLLHCPSACHRHPAVFAADGVLSGSFVVPDHEFPTAVELILTVTDEGESASVTRRIDYQATTLTLASQPAGVTLSAGTASGAAPFTTRQATGGRVTLSAPATATIGGVPHRFVRWSDGGAASHEVTVPAAATTYTATYQPS